MIRIAKKNNEMKILIIININYKAHTRTRLNIKINITNISHLFRMISVQDN